MITDTLICALLYLNVITGSGSYTADNINNFAVVYAQQISAITNNLPLLETVMEEEEPLAISVLDDLGG